MTTLIITNDFPPRPGGIQQYVLGYATRQPPGDIVVYASDWKGAAAFDATLPFPVVRHGSSLLLPTPAAGRAIAAVAREHRATTVWFGAAAPLALLTPGLRRHAGIGRAVASTHGHEVGWAATPLARTLLRRIGNSLDAVTYLGEFTRARLAPALGPHPELVRLPGGVDIETYHPGVDGSTVRARHGIATDAPVVVCVSRLVPRKGQATLIRGMARWQAVVPGVQLLLVGGGPDREALTALARERGVADAVTITGSVEAAELPAHYAAGTVFAMPCVTRRRGLEVEGLGMVFLEAAACGLPVVVGNSGGSVDALLDGKTGTLVDGRDDDDVHTAVEELLLDPAMARQLGAAGRAFVTGQFSWEVLAPRMTEVIRG